MKKKLESLLEKNALLLYPRPTNLFRREQIPLEIQPNQWLENSSNVTKIDIINIDSLNIILVQSNLNS